MVVRQRHQEGRDRKGVHADPLEPAELARHEVGDLREEQASAGRDCGDEKGQPELVAPDRSLHDAKRATKPGKPQEPEQNQDPNNHLSDNTQRRQGDDHVVRHAL
jgi:hypothetical protein